MDAVLNWLWQGGVVAAASFVMLRALERARANVRYVVCWAALGAIVALPALPAVTLSSLPPAAAAEADALVALPDTWWTSTLVVLAGWIAWTTVHVVRFASAVAAIRRARGRSRPFPQRVERALTHWARLGATGRRATLVVSDAVPAAAVLGWGRPMIAVSPSLLESLDPAELDRVLIHEWAHVQRRDDLLNLVQIGARAIAGWHPAVVWLDRRLQVEREIACDEATVGIAGSPRSYAHCLVKLASLNEAPHTLRAAPAILPAAGLRARIVKIVSTHPSLAPRWSRAIAIVIVAVVGLMSMGLGGLRIVEASALTLPFVSPRALGLTLPRLAPRPVPASVPDVATVRPLAPARRQPAAPPSPAVQVPVPQPNVEPAPVAPPAPAAARELAAGPGLEPEAAAMPLLAAAPQVQPATLEAPPDKPRAPWTVAADGGVAIGRKSKQAGLATAGFFSRAARRVAGSF